ncbi:MAG: AMP-binding protein, partial [Clostridia bacterium]|nr:AMP-binding protein [Clostridia bacterium]
MENKYKIKGQFASFTDLRDMVYKSNEAFGNKTLYIYSENDTRKEWTYNDLRANMDALGTAFSKLGLMGKRIAVIGETHPMYTTTYLATVCGNGTIIPLDKELDITQVVGFLNHAEADAIVYTSSYNKKIDAVKSELPNVKLYIPIQPDESYEKSESVISAADLIEIGNAELKNGNTSFTELEIDVEKRSAILFTSGTTGTSKGVMLSHKNIIFTLNSSVNSTSFDENCTFISILPIHHSYEMMCGQLGVIAIGATELINDSLKKVLKNLREFQPTTMIMVPMVLETMHKKVWDEIRKKGLEKKVRLAMKMNSALLKVGIDVREKLFGQITAAFGGKLNCVICGGAPVSPEIVRDFYQFGIMVLEGYGITECSPLVAVNPYGHARLRSVGPSIYGIDVKVNYDDGEKTGEILV